MKSFNSLLRTVKIIFTKEPFFEYRTLTVKSLFLIRDEDDVHFVVVACQQPTQEKPVEEFNLNEALKPLIDDLLAKELECSQETCIGRPGRSLRRASRLPEKDVVKKREDANVRRVTQQQKVFHSRSIKEVLKSYRSFKKANSKALKREQKKQSFPSSHTITKQMMTKRERSRSKIRTTTGSSYHRKQQETETRQTSGTKDLSGKIILAAKQQNRMVDMLSECHQQLASDEKNIKSKQNLSESRKRKRGVIEIDVDVDYEPIHKRRVL